MRGFLVALAFVTGCYDAQFGDCAISCTDQTGCPSEFTCETEGLCRAPGFAETCAALSAAAAKELTSFEFVSGVENPLLYADVTATISGSNITATVPSGTDVSGLVATFTTTGTRVTLDGGAEQISGQSPNDFTNAVTYRVTADDESTKVYTVTISVASITANDLTSLAFLAAKNPGLATDITGTISGTSVDAFAPSGTNVTGLVATFSTTGTSVKVGAVVQNSGTTPNNFTSPVIYRVTAGNATWQDYTVSVTIVSPSSDDLTAFSFLAVNNSGLATDVTGTINQANHTIAVVVPFGTNRAALKATWATTGASVTVGATMQVSGTTTNNFTTAVTYVVHAADGSTQPYVVTVIASVCAAICV